MDPTMPEPSPAAEPDASRAPGDDGSANAGDPVYDSSCPRITPYDPDLPAAPEHEHEGPAQ